MAKCPICNSTKGKRKCLIANDIICSQCCGTSRTEASCSQCIFYQKPRRNYTDAPAYSVSEMDGNLELESYGNAIEGALCAYDVESGNRLHDSDAIRIVELLIDKYHFRDQRMDAEPELITSGVKYVDQAIQEDLQGVPDEEITKVLGVVRFVAKRRTRTGKEYMTVIHQYVGLRLGTGIRVRRL